MEIRYFHFILILILANSLFGQVRWAAYHSIYDDHSTLLLMDTLTPNGPYRYSIEPIKASAVFASYIDNDTKIFSNGCIVFDDNLDTLYSSMITHPHMLAKCIQKGAVIDNKPKFYKGVEDVILVYGSHTSSDNSRYNYFDRITVRAIDPISTEVSLEASLTLGVPIKAFDHHPSSDNVDIYLLDSLDILYYYQYNTIDKALSLHKTLDLRGIGIVLGNKTFLGLQDKYLIIDDHESGIFLFNTLSEDISLERFINNSKSINPQRSIVYLPRQDAIIWSREIIYGEYDAPVHEVYYEDIQDLGILVSPSPVSFDFDGFRPYKHDMIDTEHIVFREETYGDRLLRVEVSDNNINFEMVPLDFFVGPTQNYHNGINLINSTSNQLTQHVNLIPNPTFNTLHIESDRSIVKVIAFNIQGIIIGEWDNTNKIDLSHCSNGSYIIQIYLDGLTLPINKSIIKISD